MAADYSALKDSLTYLSDRTDIDSDAYDRFLRLACSKLNRELRVPEMEANLSLTGTDFPYTDSSSAILEVSNLYADRSSNPIRLDYISYPRLKALQASHGGLQPKYYSTVGRTFYLGPEPASTDSIIISYYARQDDTLGDAETNVFITYYEDIITNQMLSHIYRTLHDNARAAEYEAMADSMIEDANTFAWNRRAGGRLAIRNS